MSHLLFLIPPIFVLLKVTRLVTLFDQKLQVFKKSPTLTIFGILDKLFSTQNVNVARFARNVECDFFCDFQTLCIRIFYRVYIFVFLGTVSLRSTVEIGMRRSFVVSPECQHQCAILGLSPIDQSVKLERPKGG